MTLWLMVIGLDLFYNDKKPDRKPTSAPQGLVGMSIFLGLLGHHQSSSYKYTAALTYPAAVNIFCLLSPSPGRALSLLFLSEAA